jgi:hypothetical protein
MRAPSVPVDFDNNIYGNAEIATIVLAVAKIGSFILGTSVYILTISLQMRDFLGVTVRIKTVSRS